ncbi:MAG: PAS domain-containing protein [Burkholderiaceae bacterium]
MRIRTQMLLAVASAAVLALGVLASLWHVTQNSAAALRSQGDSQEIARNTANLLMLTQEVTVYGGERAAVQWRATHARLARAVDQALARQAGLHSALAAMHQSVHDLLPLYDKLEQAYRADASDLVRRRRELIVERLVNEMQELVDARHRWARSIGEEQERDQQTFRLIILLAPGVLLLLIGGLTLLVARRVLVPLGRLQAAALAIQGGNLSARSQTSAQDELGDAARAVNAMAESLLASNTALQEEVEQRREAQTRLRLVIDNVPAQIAYIDRARRYVFSNRPHHLARGAATQGEIVGRSVDEVLGPLAYTRIQSQLHRALAGETLSFEVELPLGNESRAMLASYVPERDAAGAVRGVFATVTDVTPLRRAEQQLRTVMESSPLGVLVIDAMGYCRSANPAWHSIVGLTPEQTLGAKMGGFLHPEDHARVIAERNAVLASGVPGVGEHRYVRPDGSVVWVRRHIARLELEGYGPCFISTVEDITEGRMRDRVLAERTAELARSNDELERFAYVASHDLQEPLRMVTSYGQLLLRRHKAQLSPEAQEFLGFMVDGGQRAQALIADLLSLARVGSRALPTTPVALETVLADVLQQLRVRILDAGASVTHDALPSVAGDARQMGQLLQNLIVNAVKFRGGRAPLIHIGACREGQTWRISVSDNGIGIESRFHERIFELFQRLHLRTDYEGTGIGLAICRKVVERHGGTIGVDSEPGRGSTFFFTLPRYIPAAVPEADAIACG